MASRNRAHRATYSPVACSIGFAAMKIHDQGVAARDWA